MPFTEPLLADRTGKRIAKALENISNSIANKSNDSTEPGVKFIDYDGTVVCYYSLRDALQLANLPDNPEHDGLVSQGWNWTLQDIKEYLTKYPEALVTVGQMYTTIDGKTRIYLDVRGRKTIPIVFSQTVSNAVTLNWDDGSEEETVSGTGVVTTSHTYPDEGEYVLSFDVTDPECVLSFGDDTHSIFGNNDSFQCTILKIHIGDNISTLAKYAFDSSFWLRELTIPNTVTSILERSFYYCLSLISLTIPSGVSALEQRAFYQCSSLKHLSLNNNITTIENYAFYYCFSLTSLSLPDKLTRVKISSFQNCSNIVRINIPDSVLIIDQYGFGAPWALKKLRMSNNITSIEQYAFSNCLMLEELVFPNSLTAIKERAFNLAYNLRKFVLSTNVTRIENRAFLAIAKIEKITIPSTVTFIGTRAFGSCTGLLEIIIESETPPTLEASDVFNLLPSDCKIYVPAGKGDTYKSATNWSTYASQIYEMS